MNTTSNGKKNIYRRSVMYGITSVVLLTLILMTSTVYAWLANVRRAAAVVHISDPTAIFITAGHQEEIRYLNLGGIDVEDGGTELNANQKYRDYVICVKGIGVSSYMIQLAHTTNNQFEFQLYKATESGVAPAAGNLGSVPFVVQTSLDTDTSLLNESGDPVSVGDTIYYYIPSDGTPIPMTALNKKTDPEILAEQSDGYYSLTYSDYGYYNKYAVPIYWHSAEQTVVQSDIEFVDYFILRVIWSKDAKNDKETDILYLSAKNN